MITNERPMDLLWDYKPKSVEELAEWIMIAASNLVDADEKRVLNPLKPDMAFQIALMMQVAKLKVPK